jgi:hypothetical protein
LVYVIFQSVLYKPNEVYNSLWSHIYIYWYESRYTFLFNNMDMNQSLVDSVIIDAELGREDHIIWLLSTAIERGLKPLDARTEPQTRLNWWWKTKKNKI